MNATDKEQTAEERTTVSVYRPAHHMAVDAVNKINREGRKQKPPVKTTVTTFASEAIVAAAKAVLSPKSVATKA